MSPTRIRAIAPLCLAFVLVALVPGTVLAQAPFPYENDILYKDDCSNRTGDTDPCDDVDRGFIPVRTGPLGGTVQWVYRYWRADGSDDLTNWVLDDPLPGHCMELNCSDPCLGGPPVEATVGGVPIDPANIQCDEINDTLSISGDSIASGEMLEVRFCATFTDEVGCCNEGSLTGTAGTSQETAPVVDGMTFQEQAACVCVGGTDNCQVSFEKTDCDVDTGFNDGPDCDDIERTGDPNDPRIAPDGVGSLVEWVITLSNGSGTDQDVNVRDCPDMQEEVVDCAGCYQVSMCDINRDGDCFDCVPIDPPPGSCVEGIRQDALNLCRDTDPGFRINGFTIPRDKCMEVRFCALLSENVGTEGICNQAEGEAAGTIISSSDPLVDGGGETCISAAPAFQAAVDPTKTYLGSDPAQIGEVVSYRIDLTETLGQGDAEGNFTDPIPSGLTNVTVTQQFPNNPPCNVGGGVLSCQGLVIPAGQTISMEFQGTVACTAEVLTDGRICNQGQMQVTVPATPQPVPTERVCFDVVIPDLNQTSKEWETDDSVLPDGEVNAGERVTYTVATCNSGNGLASNVEFVDDLNPAITAGHFTYVEDSATLDGAPVTPDPETGGVITIPLGDLPPADCTNPANRRVITWQVDISPTLLNGTEVTNQGEILADEIAACAAQVLTDDPDTPASIDDPTLFSIVSDVPLEPVIAQLSKEVLDKDGQPISEIDPGGSLVYQVSWCNGGGLEAQNVTFEDDLSGQCIASVNTVLLDGVELCGPTTIPCGDPGDTVYDPATETVSFLADDVQDFDPPECHTVEMDVTLVSEAVDCPLVPDPDNPEPVAATNMATVSADNLPAGSETSSPVDVMINFEPLVENPFLYRNDAVTSLDPVTPAKGLPTWTGVMEANGPCPADPATGRLVATEVEEITVPLDTYTFNDTETGDPLVFYEAQGDDCTLTLRVRKEDAAGVTVPVVFFTP